MVEYESGGCGSSPFRRCISNWENENEKKYNFQFDENHSRWRLNSAINNLKKVYSVSTSYSAAINLSIEMRSHCIIVSWDIHSLNENEIVHVKFTFHCIKIEWIKIYLYQGMSSVWRDFQSWTWFLSSGPNCCVSADNLIRRRQSWSESKPITQTHRAPPHAMDGWCMGYCRGTAGVLQSRRCLLMEEIILRIFRGRGSWWCWWALFTQIDGSIEKENRRDRFLYFCSITWY